ncbi:hypothetical protein L6164_027338 [Bauhinia variegata]|uniref:Uncharacterized protein n=1 Tax=Bauhinia variegata TaxID=167791 RepID=A0ACB9LT29_BAUVA|nr:hypothetical protein L6164_027338 [Bauhinia variegata]
MAPEVVLQLAILTLTVAILYVVHHLRQRGGQNRSRVRTRNRDSLQSERHLVQGSRLLARARSNPDRAHSKSALLEADEALSLTPRDPAAHILKAHALDLMGHHAAALKSMDSALSSPHVKSLSQRERQEALVKRAQLKLAVNKRRRVDSAVDDLVEAVSLCEGNDSEALCLLGQCYEWKGNKEKAEEAFKRAIEVEPDSSEAHSGLDRLGLSTC